MGDSLQIQFNRWYAQRQLDAETLFTPYLSLPIPEGAMRVAPGCDAVVWKVSPEHQGEL